MSVPVARAVPAPQNYAQKPNRQQMQMPQTYSAPPGGVSNGRHQPQQMVLPPIPGANNKRSTQKPNIARVTPHARSNTTNVPSPPQPLYPNYSGERQRQPQQHYGPQHPQGVQKPHGGQQSQPAAAPLGHPPGPPQHYRHHSQHGPGGPQPPQPLEGPPAPGSQPQQRQPQPQPQPQQAQGGGQGYGPPSPFNQQQHSPAMLPPSVPLPPQPNPNSGDPQAMAVTEKLAASPLIAEFGAAYLDRYIAHNNTMPRQTVWVTNQPNGSADPTIAGHQPGFDVTLARMKPTYDTSRVPTFVAATTVSKQPNVVARLYQQQQRDWQQQQQTQQGPQRPLAA